MTDEPRPMTTQELREVARSDDWSWGDAEVIQRLLATISAKDKEIRELHNAMELMQGLDQQIIDSSEKEIRSLEDRLRQLGG